MLLEAPFCRSGVIKLPFRHSQAVETIWLGVMRDCCIEPLKSLRERSALLLGSQVLPHATTRIVRGHTHTSK